MARHRRLLAVALLAATLFGLWIAFMPHSPKGVRELVDDAGGYAVLGVIAVWMVARFLASQNTSRKRSDCLAARRSSRRL